MFCGRSEFEREPRPLTAKWLVRNGRDTIGARREGALTGRLDNFTDAAFAFAATLPLTIGLFVWRYDWSGGAAAEKG